MYRLQIKSIIESSNEKIWKVENKPNNETSK